MRHRRGFLGRAVTGLAAQQGVTVLLDGQGSDEQLGGYGSSIVESFLNQILAEGRWRAWFHERRAAAQSAPALFSWPRLALNRTPLRVVAPALRRGGGRPRLERQGLFHRDWLNDCPMPEDEIAYNSDGAHALSRTLWLLSFRTMLSSLLRFGDRLSMAHSREVRLPFCDHRVAEMCFALSPELLVGDGQVKRVLRLAIQGLVPDPIVTRPKQGFVPPQNSWLTGPLANWVQDLADSAGSLLPSLDAEVIGRLARAPLAQRTREVGAIWESSNLLAWARYALEPLRAGAAFMPVIR